MKDLKIIKTVEISHPYDDTNPDLERNVRQIRGNSQLQQQQRKDKEDKGVEEILVSYREKQGDRALYQPNLWWFTSTAFPLIAGAFGPIANLFSVCALVKTWRFDSSNGSRIPDPPWLIVLNACSLFLAIIANLILLFNFAHRIRYAIAQPLTIILWYMSSIFFIIALALTHHPTSTYSQSFFYGLISAVMYFNISTLLLFNLLGASLCHAYPPTFGVLTDSQRTLMLQTISYSLYLALGAGVFCAIEGWSFTDGVYWADYTLLTIGFGSDFPLKTTLGRMLLIPYAAFGITLLGLVISSVRGLVLERAKEKVAMRHLGKERDRWTDSINKTMKTKDGTIAPRQRSFDSLICWHYRRHKKLQDLPRVIAHAKSIEHQDHRGVWHRAEFDLMRYIQITSEQSERYIALAASFLVFLIVWIGGSLVFWATERKHQRWTYPESLYFTYTTLLTIGYGDFFPASPAGRPFFVIWSLLAVPAMTILIGNMGDTVVRGVQEVTDWMGRRTVLPERSTKGANKNEGWWEEKTAQPSSENTSNKAFASLAPSSSSYGLALPVRNYADLPLASISSREGQEETAAPQAESSLTPKKTAPIDPDTFQKPQRVKQAEAALLACEISKLAKDVCQHPPKKYRWDEWITWLEMLGDEAVGDIKAMEHDKQVSMNTPKTDTNQNTQVVEHSYPDNHQHHHKHHRRYHSQPNAHLNRPHGLGKDGEWHWTWLNDKGPLFSQQTETEWILSRLCSRLEHLMNSP